MITRRNAALVLAAALSLAGCIPNDASVRIFGACGIPEDAKCVFKSTCDSLYIGRLVVDVSHPGQSLVWPIQLDNQRPDNATADGATTTSIAWLEGYEVEFTSTTPGVSVAPLTVNITTSPIQPKGSTVAVAPLIPPSVGAYLATQPAAELTVAMRAIGRYGDGTTFQSGPAAFEVRTCFGCVPYFDDTICDTVDNSTTPPTVTPGTLSGVCPQQGQTVFYACK